MSERVATFLKTAPADTELLLSNEQPVHVASIPRQVDLLLVAPSEKKTKCIADYDV